MNEKKLIGLAVIGVGAYLLFIKQPAQATGGQLAAASVADSLFRDLVAAKNWMLDSLKVTKEPYFTPDP